MKKIFRKFDGWSNLFTNLGVDGKDKTMANEILHLPLTEIKASNIYAGDDIARRIVEIVPTYATKKWIDLIGDFTGKDEIIKNIKKLNVKSKFKEAWIDARVYGGAVILLVMDDKKENWFNPIGNLNKRKIQSLIVYNRHQIINGTKITDDPESNNFGFPETFILQHKNNIGSELNNLEIHHSRFIRFDGLRLPDRMFISNQYWHDSVLSAVYQIVSDYAQVNKSIVNLVMDYRSNILKIRGLADKISNVDTTNVLSERIQILNLLKSVLRTTVLDFDDEEYEQNTPQNMAGLNDLIRFVTDRLVTASGIPHTILLGESPSGLAATGRSEENSFYEDIANKQTEFLESKIDYFFDILFSGNPPSNFRWEFAPIKENTEKEKAEISELMSRSDERYYNAGIVTAAEIASSRFGGHRFSVNTELDLSLRNESNEIPEPQLENENEEEN